MNTSYIEKVKRTQPSHFVGYWPLNEERGTVVYNAVRPAAVLAGATTTTEQNGVSANLVRGATKTGLLSPDGGVCAQFDGSTTYIDMVSCISSSATTTGSMGVWAAVPEANLAGTTKMVLFHFGADANNYAEIQCDTTANRFTATHNGASTAKTSTGLVYNAIYGKGGKDIPHDPTWHYFGFDFADGGALNFYVDGVAQTAGSSLGTWSGTLATTLCCLGSDSTTISDAYAGWLSHFMWWNKVLTADEWRELSKAGHFNR